MDILKTLEQEFKLKPFQVENTVSLIDEGILFPLLQDTERKWQVHLMMKHLEIFLKDLFILEI